jgi:succinate dehydrogenase / fumarate reductase membrane anchor subunit
MDKPALRSPLGTVRGLGSAKSGTHHWIVQRMTAVALIGLGLWFVYSIVRLGGQDYFAAYGWLHQPLNALLTALFVFSALWHGKLGLQVVLEDYVHSKPVKVVSLLLLNFLTVGLIAVAGYSLAVIAFGA